MMKLHFQLLAATALFASVQGAPATISANGANSSAAEPTVTISSGVVIGTAATVVSATASTVTVNEYLGIPFAAPPTGTARFQPPVAPTAWAKPLDATALPDSCIQQFIYPPNTNKFLQEIFNNPGFNPPVESEDCLYLNVYAPTDASPSNKKSVLFWIFGGNLQFGTGSLAQYNGSFFAGYQDVVVVTFNYRTNIFGFPGAPELASGEQNIGFLDQRLALKWVTDNIEQFGGDPDQVTIFGESAGGVSVKQLLAQPPSPLPFRAAIMQSEQAVLPSTAAAGYKATIRHFGCTNAASPIACLQGVSATDLRTYISENNVFFAPVSDKVTYTSDVRPNLDSKQFANVPFFMGTNRDEGRVFAAAAGFDNSTATIEDLLNLLFPNDVAIGQAVAAFYAPFFSSVYLFASQVLTDLGFTCTTSSLSNYAANAGYSVWRYYYSAVFPDESDFPDPGAYHTSEIPQVFGTYQPSNSFGNATADQEALSQYMQTTWANFAKNPSAGPGWAQVSGSPLANTLAELGGAEAPTGHSMIAPGSVDYVCFIYNPIIGAIGL